MDVDFSADGNSLAIVDAAGYLRILRAAPFSEIDRHPLTIRSMYLIGVEQNQDRRFAAAELTLRKTLRRQEQTLPLGHPELQATRTEISHALEGQGKYPSLTSQPVSAQVAMGERAHFHIDVQRDGPCSYQWFFDGRPIAGRTEPTLEIDHVTKGDLGRYYVVVQSSPSDPDVDPVRSQTAFLVEKDYAYSPGGLKLEIFKNIRGGDNVSNLVDSTRYPDRPDLTSVISTLEVPRNQGDNFGARITGFVKPPITGNYVFHVISNDDGEFHLSTDESPENSRRIAANTSHRFREWESTGSEAISEPIHLEAQKRYWMEGIFIEEIGNDYFSVTWQTPGEPPPENGDPPISGDFLEHRLE